VRARLSSYAADLRHVQPLLNGHDLRDLGVLAGPETGRALEELRAAVLDGEVWGRDEEEAWVRRRLGGR
jgi:tRNA nucleotidyltransferase (CCA-adding enzyme)